MSFVGDRGLTGRGHEGEVAVTSVIIGAPGITGDITALADDLRKRGVVAADALVCDMRWLTTPDCATVDALARLQLTARRLGRRICLRHASRELVELLALAGLSDVLPCEAGSGVQVSGEAEEREEPGGVQEERDAGDSAV